MPDHPIRLRGGWESYRPGSTTVPERLTLPTRWDSDWPGRLRLLRRFGSPPIDPGQQALLLVLERVLGIHSIRLNDQEIPHVSPERSNYQIRLDGLPPRNVLILEVEPPSSQGPMNDDDADWGFISLVIQSQRDGGNSPEPI